MESAAAGAVDAAVESNYQWSVVQYRYSLHVVYRMTMVVAHLGWVDLDLGCTTLLLGSR